jgi:flagellar motor switch protein FliG
MSVVSVASLSPIARRLGGADRVAALLLAMGQTAATRILKHLDAYELREITRATAALGSVSAPTIDILIEDFAGHFSGGLDLLGAPSEAEQLLSGALPPEQVADILSDVLGSSNHTMWEKLSSLSDTLLNDFVAEEHPQATAYLLSKLSSATAARALAAMSRDKRNDILARMMGIGGVTEAARRLIETTLHDTLLVAASRSGGGVPARMADIINRFEREAVDDAIASLSEARPKEAKALKAMLFSFEDIPGLSARARAILFDKAPTDRVILALRGVSMDFRDIVLSSLASRARRMVEAELDSGATPPRKDIDQARRDIANMVLQLAAANEIELRSEDQNGAES